MKEKLLNPVYLVMQAQDKNETEERLRDALIKSARCIDTLKSLLEEASQMSIQHRDWERRVNELLRS